MSNGGQRIAVVGHGSAGLAAALVAVLEHDIKLVELDEVEPRRDIALVCVPRTLDLAGLICDPGVQQERGGKRGSADWKQHTNRRGKRRKWSKKR